MSPSVRARGLIAALLMTVLFGASFVGSKVALADFTPFELIFLRFFIASLLFLIASPWLKAESIRHGDRLKLLILCIMEPVIYFYLEAMGLKRTQASTAAVLICTIPLYVLVLEVVWMKLKFRMSEALLILLSIAGIVLLVSTPGAENLGGEKMAGNIFILCGSFAAAVYTIMASRLLERYSAVTITRVQSFYAVLFYLPFFGFDLVTKGLPYASMRSWIAVLYLGVGCSFFAYLFLNISLTHLRPSTVSTFANLVPVVAAGLAVLILKEHLSWTQAGGAAVVILAVFLIARRKPKIEPQIVPAVG